MSVADGVAVGILGSPLGIIASIAGLRTYGRTSGGGPDLFDPATGIPYGVNDEDLSQPAGGILPPFSIPDVIASTPPPTTTNPIGIPTPVQPGPTYPPPAQRGGVPGPENVDSWIKRNRERLDERLRGVGRKTGKKPPKPPKPPKSPLGDYDWVARACVSNPVLCAIGGALFPNPVADATLTKAEQRAVKKQRTPPRVARRTPKIPTKFDYSGLEMPRLPGVPGSVRTTSTGSRAAPRPARPSRPPKIARAAVKIPRSFPYPLPMPSIPGGSSPGIFGRVGSALGLRLPTLEDLTPLVVGLLARPRATSQPISTITNLLSSPSPSPSPPVATPSPLTPILTGMQPFPLSGGGGDGRTGRGTLEDQCRNLNKRRKPKRKCIKRDDCNKCVEYAPI